MAATDTPPTDPPTEARFTREPPPAEQPEPTGGPRRRLGVVVLAAVLVIGALVTTGFALPGGGSERTTGAAAPAKGAEADETGNVAELGNLRPGANKTLALSLRPGHDALICNLPGHYLAGQHTDFTVR
jgi:hypothetical protein